MGNDGGSIPDRRDLVRTKGKAEQADKANQTRARWFFCALSKRPLQEPIVSCALGKLYNKDAILEFLIDKAAYGDGQEICGHIKSTKDIKELKLTPNPVPPAPDSQTEHSQFVCPLTLKEMNGGVPFVYIATCGCVVSQAGLKALASSTGSSSPPPSDEDRGKGKEAEKDVESTQLDLCPQCGAKYNRVMDVRTLNPEGEVEEAMRAAMEARRREKAASKSKNGKSKKRKAGDADADAEPATETKKAKAAPTMNPTIAAASRAVVSSLAAKEVERKAGMSDAVRSLYESKTKGMKEKDSSWMTRTFNRYA